MNAPGPGGTPQPAPHQAAASAAHWRSLALGGAGGMFVAMGLGRFSYTSMVPALVEQGGLDAVTAGRIGMANLAGFLAGAMASVTLGRRFARARVLRTALVLCLAGLAGSALPWGPWWLGACRGGAGFATGLIMVLSLTLITESAPAERRPAAASYVFTGVGLGILSAGVLVPVLLAHGLMLAWLGLMAAGLAGAALALWGWRAGAGSRLPAATTDADLRAGSRRGLPGLLLAHALFSLGIVPHTLYWVDYLVRAEGLSQAAAGLHWSVVGVCAVLGPFATMGLARLTGTAWALVIAFLVLAAGIGVPAACPLPALLVVSSMIFGAQPGQSSLMAARARDLADAAIMGPVMRAMILSNACGAVAGGIIVPWLYGATGSHAALFALGAAAMLAGAVAARPAASPDPASGAAPERA